MAARSDPGSPPALHVARLAAGAPAPWHWQRLAPEHPVPLAAEVEAALADITHEVLQVRLRSRARAFWTS